MANIFDGIAGMTDNQLRIEIALFSQVTLSNAAIETGNRVLGSVVDMANSIMQSLGGKQSWEYDVVRVSDMVNSAYERLLDKDREWLLGELERQIIQKLGSVANGAGFNTDKAEQKDISNIERSSIDNGELNDTGNAERRDISKAEVSDADKRVQLNEKLSVMVINEAAVTYGLEKYDTPANKIEKISIEYNKAYLQAIHNVLCRQTSMEAVETDRRLQKRLDLAPIEAKRDLQRKIMPKEFSGTGIGRVLRLERGTKNLTYVVEILGGACFGDIQTHVATVLASVRALRKPSRVLLAQLVWQARQCYGTKFTVDRTLLPSYIPETERLEQEADERNLRQQLAVMAELEKKQEKCAEAVRKNDEQKKEAETRLENLLGVLEKQQKEFAKLEEDKERYVSGRMPESDTKRYYRNVNDTSRQMASTEETVQKQKAKLKELYEKGDRLMSELSAAGKETEENRAVISEKIALIAGELKNRWRAYYFRYEFEDEVFEKVAEYLWRSERLNLEEFLKEIHDSKSFVAVRNMEIYASSVENPDSEVISPNNDGQAYKEAAELQNPVAIVKCNIAKGRNVAIKAEGNVIKAIELI